MRISFFLNSTESLLRAAENSKSFGKYKLADYLFEKVFQLELDKKGWSGAFEIVVKRLDFYKETRRDVQFVQYVRSLAKQNRKEKMLGKKQERILVERVKRYIRILQDKAHRDEIGKVLFSFDTLKILNPKESLSYTFYQGEALYAQKKYNKALDKYRKALSVVLAGNYPKNKKIIKSIFDSIIKSLAESDLGEIQKKKWNTYIYTSHMEIYPVNERSRKMYQKLYNVYYKDKKYKKCKDVLNLYVKNYPHRVQGKKANQDDVTKHQVMISKIIDYYIKKNKYKQASREIDWLKRDEFAFDKKYIAKISDIFNYKIFESVRKEKNVRVRNDKYQNIYKSEMFPSFVRSDSAWYVGENFIKSKNTPIALDWAQKSIELLSRKDSLKRQKNVLELVVRMIYLQDFVSAEKMAKWYFVRHCKDRYDLKNDFYNAMVLYSLVDGRRNDHVMENFKRGHQCGVDKNILFENVKVIAGFLRDSGHIDELKELYRNHAKSNQAKKYFKSIFLDYYWESFIAGNKKGQRVGLELLGEKGLGGGKDVASVLKFHKLVQELKEQKMKGLSLYKAGRKFDEKEFNRTLESEVVKLNEFKDYLEKYMKSRHPQVVIYVNWILYERFKSFGKAILAVKPSGVDDNYKKTFRQAMRPIGNQFLQEARSRKKAMNRIIYKSDVLPGIHRRQVEDVHFALSWGR